MVLEVDLPFHPKGAAGFVNSSRGAHGITRQRRIGSTDVLVIVSIKQIVDAKGNLAGLIGLVTTVQANRCKAGRGC